MLMVFILNRPARSIFKKNGFPGEESSFSNGKVRTISCTLCRQAALENCPLSKTLQNLNYSLESDGFKEETTFGEFYCWSLAEIA